jgi:uncharacterized phage-associated protein
VPAWSEEIAGVLAACACDQGVPLDQMHLQKLVYIAHGWRLAFSGEPLTGDRPEVLAHGPEYRRLAERLASCGTKPVPTGQLPLPDASALDTTEVEVIAAVWDSHRGLAAEQLSAVTRSRSSPWSMIWAGGRGSGQEISHKLVRQQFASLVELSGMRPPRETERRLGAAEVGTRRS